MPYAWRHIDGKITEGIPSLSPIEFMVTANHAESKVTACHAMRGTHSSGDNIREEDTMLEVAMDHDKDFSAECHMRGDIIDSNVTEGIPSLSPVEFMVTSNHAKSKVWLATPCMGPAVPGTTLGRETQCLK
jgi:hypothetical protein